MRLYDPPIVILALVPENAPEVRHSGGLCPPFGFSFQSNAADRIDGGPD